MPTALQDQRRRQRFAQGRFAVPGAVAALGERLAGSVNTDGDHVVADADIKLEQSAGFAEPVLVVSALEALDHGALDDFLHVGGTHQRGLDALGAHGKARVAGQKFFPRKRLDALKQFFIAARFELPHAQVNAVGCTQPEVGLKGGFKIAFEHRAAHVHNAHVLRPEALEIPPCHAFQPKGGACDPFHQCFNPSPSRV